MSPVHGHPVFSGGSGQDFVKLQSQASVLFCLVANVSHNSTSLIMRRNHKFVENL